MLQKDDTFCIEVPHDFSSTVKKIEGPPVPLVRFQAHGKTCHVPYEWCKKVGPDKNDMFSSVYFANSDRPLCRIPFRVGDIVHIKHHGDDRFVIERVLVGFIPGYDVSPISNPRFVRRFSHDDLTLVSRPPNGASQDKLDLETAIENLKYHGISKYQFENRLLDVLKLITKKLYG